MGVLQLHQLFPTVVATTQLPLDPLQQASCLRALLELRGEAEGNPNEGCAWTGDLHGVWQLHQQQPFQALAELVVEQAWSYLCLLYTSPSPRDRQKSRMPSSA